MAKEEKIYEKLNIEKLKETLEKLPKPLQPKLLNSGLWEIPFGNGFMICNQSMKDQIDQSILNDIVNMTKSS